MSISFEAFTKQIDNLLIDAAAGDETRPVWAVSKVDEVDDLPGFPVGGKQWLETIGWKPRAGSTALLQHGGELVGAVLGLGNTTRSPYHGLLAGALPSVLPEGAYHFASGVDDLELATVGWLLGAYTFTRFKTAEEAARGPRRLRLPPGVDRVRVRNIANAVWMGRELINYPANELGPAELELCARHVADQFAAHVHVVEGVRLLSDNFPLIHAVGRASDRLPRLIDLTWGDKAAPKVTIVGKGICFDTGGLNIKPPSAMGLMKKDMGGAAAALTLGAMIMTAALPVRLRVLIPAADNNISANAFRPGDIIKARNGTTVEIANTDAEGRLVLADALSLADEEAPEYLFNLATLTGAARVALGPDLPPFYTEDEELAAGLLSASRRVADPLWRLPFWQPYEALLKSRVADVNHIYTGPFAGSMTAALFLKRFVKNAARFAHFDIYAWVPRTQPARPAGGEPQGARALFEFLQAKFIKP